MAPEGFAGRLSRELPHQAGIFIGNLRQGEKSTLSISSCVRATWLWTKFQGGRSERPGKRMFGGKRACSNSGALASGADSNAWESGLQSTCSAAPLLCSLVFWKPFRDAYCQVQLPALLHRVLIRSRFALFLFDVRRETFPRPAHSRTRFQRKAGCSGRRARKNKCVSPELVLDFRWANQFQRVAQPEREARSACRPGALLPLH